METFEITSKISPFPLSLFYQVFGLSNNKTKTLQGITDCERLKYLGKDGVTGLTLLWLLKADIGRGILPLCTSVACEQLSSRPPLLFLVLYISVPHRKTICGKWTS